MKDGEKDQKRLTSSKSKFYCVEPYVCCMSITISVDNKDTKVAIKNLELCVMNLVKNIMKHVEYLRFLLKMFKISCGFGHSISK